jgi:hypothetical protein
LLPATTVKFQHLVFGITILPFRIRISLICTKTPVLMLGGV